MSLVGRFQGYRGVCHSSRVLQNKPLPTLLVSPNAPEPSQLHKPLRRAQIQVEEEEVLRLWLPPLLARSKLLRMCLRVLGTGNGNEIDPPTLHSHLRSWLPPPYPSPSFHMHIWGGFSCTNICLPPWSHRAVPSQLAGRGHDTHLSQRFDQKESQRLEALLMQSGERLSSPWFFPSPLAPLCLRVMP